MAGYTHKVGSTYTSDLGLISSTTETFLGTAEEGVDVSVLAGAVNQLEQIDVTKANIVSVCLFASGACTLKTNSSGSPQETIVFAPGMQVIWNTSSTVACPFAGNITAFYLSNPGVAAVRFRMECLLSA